MIDDEITDENYCDWRQSNCPWVKDLRARMAALESALKKSNDTLHELTAIIPGNDKGALDAVANAMRTNRAAYLGEKE